MINGELKSGTVVSIENTLREINKFENTYIPPPVYYLGRQLDYNVPSGSYTNDDDWVIQLSRYERDNLLALINAIGYPWGFENEPGRKVPYDSSLQNWNSGDWVGMIGQKLADRAGNCYSQGANWYDKNPPTPEEWQSMQRMLQFVRGQLLASAKVNDEQ